MDGMFSTAPKVASPPKMPFVGILYAEDFDDPAEPDHTEPESAPEPSAPPPITQADVENACVAAVRQARMKWEAEQEQARQKALSALGEALGEMREEAERLALETAEATAKTILAMVQGLLPKFSEQHGPAEVKALLAHLLPTIRSRDRIHVRVHPDLVALVQRDLGELQAELSAPVDVVAAPIGRGDVKVTWENGSLVRDTRQIAQAIEDVLIQLGLHQPVEAPAKRSMAYAD